MNAPTLVLLGRGAGDEVVYSQQSVAWASAGLTEIGVPHEVALLDTPAQLHERADASRDYLVLFHGGWGEGGGAQRILEEAGCRFSGSRRDAASACLDKVAAKQGVSRAGIHTPEIYSHDKLSRHPKADCGPVALRKPRYGGSSLGISLLDRSECLRIGDDAECGCYFVEEFVHGTSVSVTVVHTRTRLEILPPMAILPHDELIYGFITKQRSARDYLDLQALFGPDVVAAAAALARTAHLALGCFGITRVDLIIDRDGAPHFLEINSIPGLGACSNILFTYALAGRTTRDLLRDLVGTIV